jgi:hypothetical protein
MVKMTVTQKLCVYGTAADFPMYDNANEEKAEPWHKARLELPAQLSGIGYGRSPSSNVFRPLIFPFNHVQHHF